MFTSSEKVKEALGNPRHLLIGGREIARFVGRSVNNTFLCLARGDIPAIKIPNPNEPEKEVWMSHKALLIAWILTKDRENIEIDPDRAHPLLDKELLDRAYDRLDREAGEGRYELL